MTKVRFTTGPLGVLTEANGVRFAEATVGEGDEGTIYEGSYSAPEGWLVIETEAGFVPVHPAMVEVVES